MSNITAEAVAESIFKALHAMEVESADFCEEVYQRIYKRGEELFGEESLSEFPMRRQLAADAAASVAASFSVAATVPPITGDQYE